SMPSPCASWITARSATGIYCRAVCTRSVYSYQPDLFEDCGGAST
ncbi:hypothetical protein ACI4XT_006036, partial [Klebsiella pneumoniae]|nr:hypothetical protein [Escherichia coli]